MLVVVALLCIRCGALREVVVILWNSAGLRMGRQRDDDDDDLNLKTRIGDAIFGRFENKENISVCV